MTFKTKIVCTIFCLQIFAAVPTIAQSYFRAIDSLEWMPQVDAYGQNSFVGVGAKQLIKIDSNGNLYNCKQIKNSNPLIWEWGFLNFIQNPDSSTIFVGSYTLWPSDAYIYLFCKV